MTRTSLLIPRPLTLSAVASLLLPPLALAQDEAVEIAGRIVACSQGQTAQGPFGGSDSDNLGSDAISWYAGVDTDGGIDDDDDVWIQVDLSRFVDRSELAIKTRQLGGTGNQLKLDLSLDGPVGLGSALPERGWFISSNGPNMGQLRLTLGDDCAGWILRTEQGYFATPGDYGLEGMGYEDFEDDPFFEPCLAGWGQSRWIYGSMDVTVTVTEVDLPKFPSTPIFYWGEEGQWILPIGLGETSAAPKNTVAGDGHTVTLFSDGSVACWGSNSYGQCNVPSGIGTPENPVASVAAGNSHTVALLADGSVACWGRNDDGQCDVPSGIGTPENPVIDVAAGDGHTVAVLADGSVACWGSNFLGQCDVPSWIGTPENPVASVTAGPSRTVALLVNGSVSCWGNSSWCNIPGGVGTPENPVTDVAAGSYHTVALLADGSVACWGDNSWDQCDVPSGIGTPENPVTGIAAGESHTVALLADGSVACWGSNGYGQCDVGCFDPATPFESVSAGRFVSVATLQSQPVSCPGDLNGDGVVGGADLALMITTWGPCTACDADLNGDGDVNGNDLGLMFAAWGACGAG